MSRWRAARAVAIVAATLGIAAAFWLPTLGYRDVFAGMMTRSPAEASSLHALARGECGLRLPIRRIGVSGDLGLRWITCRSLFGLYSGGISMSGTTTAYRDLDPDRGTIPWLAFLALEVTGGLLLYRTLRTRP